MKKFLKNRFSFLTLIIFGFLFFSLTVFAVDKCSLVNWPKSPIGTDINPTLEGGKCKYADLPTLIKYLYEWGIGLGGLAAFIALVIAGFQYLTSVGDPAKMKDAKDRIISAFFGLTLLLGSWLILNTISPNLTTLPPLELKPPEERISSYSPCQNDEECCANIKDKNSTEYKNCIENYECKKLKEGEPSYCVLKSPEKKGCKEVLPSEVEFVCDTIEGVRKTISWIGNIPKWFGKIFDKFF
jgi:hypothetical protein